MREALLKRLEDGLREDSPALRTTPTRRQRVTLLLGSYLDAIGSGSVEQVRAGKPASRVLQHSELWYGGSYPELDSWLRVLRRQAPRVHWHTWEMYVAQSKLPAIRRHRASLGAEFLKRKMPAFIRVPDEVLVRGGFKAESKRAA